MERESPGYTAAHLHALIESTRDMIWSVDLNYRLVTFNKALSDEFKYNHGIGAKAGMGPFDLLTPDRAALWPPLYERALMEGPFQTEFRMADGRYLELGLNPIVENGKNTGVWVLSKDITERRAARQSLVSVIEALRATEERYHTAFETCTDSITISRMSDGMILDANKAFLDFFGFSREEIVGRTAPELGMWVEPRERDILLETVRREGKCRNLEVHTRLKSGEITWTLLSASTIELDGTTCLLSVGRDITEHKTAEQSLAAAAQALRASEARYRTAFQTSTEAISIIRLSDRKHVDVNQAFLDITGFRREEVIGQTLQEIDIWADPSDEEKAVGLLQRTSKVRDLEVQYRRKNGATIWGLTSAAIIEIDSQPHVLAITRDITERKRAEMALRESNDLMQLFVEHAPVSIAMFDREMRYLAASRQHQTGLGLAAREIIGHSHFEFFPNLPEHFKEAHRRAMAGEVVSGEDLCPKGLLGVEIWGRWSVHPWYTGAGAVGGIVLFTEDLTERKRAEKELADYQGKLVAALANMTDSVCITDASGEAINYNDAFAMFHRFRSKAECPTSLSGMRERVEAITPDGNVVPPEERAASRALRGETATNVEYNMRRRDTGETWIGNYSFSPIRGTDGAIMGAVVVARDITERKAAQEALEKAEQKFRDIFESAPEGIFQTTPTGKLLAVNPAGAIMLGYSRWEDPNSVVHDLARDIWLDPRERARFMEDLERHGEIEGFSSQLKCKDGAIKWVSISARKICGADGKTLYYQGFIEDLTSRMAAEEARRKAEQRFREIFEDAPEGIFQITPEGRALAFNPATAKMLGYESAEEAIIALQNTAHELWPDSMDCARFIALLEQQGTVRDYRHQLKRRDGSLLWASTTARKIRGPDGKTICYQGFTQDITEQKRLEVALRANSRELELLSEINNALVHAKTEKDLLRICCRIMVEIGGYRAAWVGFAGEGPDKPIVTIADYGFEEGFLEGISSTFTWAEAGLEDGPVGRSLRTGEVQVLKRQRHIQQLGVFFGFLLFRNARPD